MRCLYIYGLLRLFLLVVLVLVVEVSIGQSIKDAMYRIELTDGSNKEVRIKYINKRFIKAERSSGGYSLIPFRLVKSIELSDAAELTGLTNTRSLKYKMSLGVIGGYGYDEEDSSLGWGASASVLYDFSQYANLGVGMAYDRIDDAPLESFIPVYFELDGSLGASYVGLHYGLKVGYAFAAKESDVLTRNGGYYLYPSIGIQFQNITTVTFIDLGYRFIGSEYNNNRWGNRMNYSIKYKRLSLTAGIKF